MKRNHRTTIIVLSTLFTVFIFSASYSKLQHHDPTITITLYVMTGIIFIIEMMYIYNVLRNIK